MHFAKWITLVAGLQMACFANAQSGTEFSGFEFLPYRVEGNPALRPLAKTNVALPVLGNIHLDHHNNWLRPNAAVGDVESGRTVLDTPSMLRRIGDAAVTSQEISIGLFHVGARIGKNYFHLGVKERVNLRISLPADLFYLAAYGNAGSHTFENHTADFSGLAVHAVHYREHSLGFSRQIGEKWTVGATAKYLYGMANITTEESSLKLRTDPNTYALQSSGAMMVRTSGLSMDEDPGAYLLGKKNHGGAVDVGAVFRPMDKLQLAVSVHDLGRIRWTEDISNHGTDDAGFLHDGFDVSDFVFGGESFGDSLTARIEELESALDERYGLEGNSQSYTTSLHGYIRFGAEYHLWEVGELRGKATLHLVHGLWDEAVPLNISAGYIQQVGRVLEAGIKVGKRGDARWGLGGGFVLNAGFLQLFAMVDNVNFLALTQVTHISDSGEPTRFSMPSNTDDVRVSLGLNLTFGRKVEREGR